MSFYVFLRNLLKKNTFFIGGKKKYPTFVKTLKHFKMKKTLLLAVAAVFVLGATSCKKDRTCECCTTFLGQTACAESTIKETKKKAEEACEKGNVAGVSTCKIK